MILKVRQAFNKDKLWFLLPLQSVYNESSEDLERLCPLALYGAEMNIVSNSIQFGNVLKTARGCADCRDDYDLLLKEQCERPATKLDAQLTNEEVCPLISISLSVLCISFQQTRHRIEYSKFLAHVDKMLAKKEHEARSEFEEVAENREQGEVCFVIIEHIYNVSHSSDVC